METIAYGPTAALVQVASAREAADVAAWLRTRVAALDVVPGATSVLVDGVPAEAVRAVLAGGLGDVSGRMSLGAESPAVSLPVVFDGPDLGFVAEVWGVPAGDVVARLTSLELVSAFCGFAPGFAYLAGLPAEWEVPRLETPRPRIEAGSVAIGGTWCGAYPTASPGGWRLVGRTEVALWDAERTPPALLTPGTRVRFVEASPTPCP